MSAYELAEWRAFYAIEADDDFNKSEKEKVTAAILERKAARKRGK